MTGYGSSPVRVVYDPEARRSTGPSALDDRAHAVTVGVFDGVHLGHRWVIDSTAQAAERLGVATAVVTFDPHPAVVLRPDVAPKLLTDLDQKLGLLESAGVDSVVVVRFDHERAGERAEDFVAAVLVDCLRARAVIVGHDFQFGKDRKGDVRLLTELGGQYGFEVLSLSLMSNPSTAGAESHPVSSTAIRAALARGDVISARRLLGRPHEIAGTVVTGDRRGRTIGFPTANLAVESNRAIPVDGVYAGWFHLPPDDEHRSGRSWPAAINIGKRPTFHRDAEHSVVEAHLIDFDGDLYGLHAAVGFEARLRGEQRFDGIEALAAQLQSDIASARSLLQPD